MTALWSHALSEATIGNSLQEQGHIILWVRCKGIMKKSCPAMSAYGISDPISDPNANKVCKQCKKQQNILSKLKVGSEIWIEDYITHIPDEQADIDFVINNVPIGKLATYEIILKYKKRNLHFTPSQFSEYQAAFNNTLAIYLSMHEILKAYSPEYVIMTNTYYSCNQATSYAAKKLGMSVYHLHSSSNFSKRLTTFMLGKNNEDYIISYEKKLWEEKFSIQPTSLKSISSVLGHYKTLISAASDFVYSEPLKKPFNIYDYFNIKSNKKIILAVMGSMDERLAAQTIGVLSSSAFDDLLFSSQIDWLQYLIAFIKKHTEYALIIRIHPRECPNKRENESAEHFELYSEIFKSLPDNVFVNYPSDKIPILQLAKFTHLCLHAGSTVGRDFALLGIPVLNFMRFGMLYPSNLTPTASNLEEFDAMIGTLICTGWNLEYARRAFRWSGIELHDGVFDLSDQISLKEIYDYNLPQRILRKILRIFSPNYEKNYAITKIKDCLKEGPLINKLLINNQVCKLDQISRVSTLTDEQETQAIIEALDKLMSMLYFKNEYYAFPTLRDSFHRYKNSKNLNYF